MVFAQGPAIGNVQVSNLTATSATINFSTGVAVFAGVSYAPGSGFWSSVNEAYAVNHSVVLSGLTAGTAYTYVPWYSGGSNFPGYSFVTPSGGPAISNVAVSNLSSTSATITFSTGTSIFAGVSYAGANGAWYSVNEITAINHTIVLSGLTPGTAYSYVPWYSGGSNLPGYSFTTQTIQPGITNVQVAGITSTSATITFSTGVAEYGGVSYAAANGSWYTLNEANAVNHSVMLTGLSAGTKYSYVPWYGGGSNFAGYTFTTAPASAPPITPPDPTVPVPPASSTTTNIAVGTNVIQTGIKRLGMNIEGQDYYDSGQMLRNLTFRNPGFEGETWQTILHCAAVTSSSCTDANTWSPWPANFLQGGSFEFIYGGALGQTGTVSSSTTASNNTGVTINFPSTSKSPAVGDFVVVTAQIPGNAQAGWWSSTSGGGTLTTDLNDLSPETPGKQALSMNAASHGQTAQVDSYFDTTNTHNFVLLNGTYQITFRAKGTGGSNQMTVTFGRQVTGGAYFNQTVALSQNWQDYTFKFNAAETPATGAGTADLRFQVSGASVYLDDVSLAPATTNSANPTAFRDEVVSTLTSLRPGTLRYMDDGGASFGSSIANMLATPFARQRSGSSLSSATQEDVPLGLNEFLQLCQTVGAEPWYVLPAAISPSDMRSLMDYLGGSSSTPYGAIRASLGQSAPWTSVFPVIHLELGNEQWNNGTFPGQVIDNGIAYGNRITTIFGAARNSPSYQFGKFDLIMGGQVVNSWLTGQEAASASNYDSIAVAPYLFGTFSDTSSTEAIYGPMFAEPEQWDDSPTGYMSLQAQAAQTAGKNLVVYEENISTQSGTASQSMINSVVPSVGGGVMMADHMLLQMRDLGIKTQNVWALPGYSNQFSNPDGGAEISPVYGTVVDMGGQTNLRRPVFLAEQLTNMAILPQMLGTVLSGANPTWNQPLSTNDSVQLTAAHELQSFAFTDGAHSRSVVVINLSRTAALPVTFSGANAPSGTVNISQLTSTNLTDTNEAASTVATTSNTVNNFPPATAYSLPPFSVTVFTWQQ
jgi:alpha-L-arabinofuranosidase